VINYRNARWKPETVIVALDLTLGSVGEASFFLFCIVLGISFWPAVQMSFKSFKQDFLILETHPELREEEARHNKQ
jgi:hypothetical protein